MSNNSQTYSKYSNVKPLPKFIKGKRLLKQYATYRV